MNRVYAFAVDAVFEVAYTVGYLAAELVIGPLLDRINGSGYDAWIAAKRAEFYHQHEYD